MLGKKGEKKERGVARLKRSGFEAKTGSIWAISPTRRGEVNGRKKKKKKKKRAQKKCR